MLLLYHCEFLLRLIRLVASPGQLLLEHIDFLYVGLLDFAAHPFGVLLALDFQLALELGDEDFVHVVDRLQVGDFLLEAAD